MARWKARGDGKPVAIPELPWQSVPDDLCPALKKPCLCRPGGLARDLCRKLVENAKAE
jgi:hypothetical protein